MTKEKEDLELEDFELDHFKSFLSIFNGQSGTLIRSCLEKIQKVLKLVQNVDVSKHFYWEIVHFRRRKDRF